MMNIGISYWGFLESYEDSLVSNTPDGHRFGRPILVDELSRRGHNVFALQPRRETYEYEEIYNYDSEGFPNLDVLLLEWRWPTYKNSGENPTEPDLKRQEALLEHYHGQIPVVIWDCDHKVTAEDEKRWPKAIIADPSVEPKFLTRKRERLMFWTDWRTLLPVAETGFEYGYIGNNYERDDQFERFYGHPSKYLRESGIQTTVHGNWLQKSPERVSPSFVITKNAHVAFGQRLNFRESMARLNSFVATTHISKPDYSKCGFVSPRFLENLATSTPALVPRDLLHRNFLGEKWIVDDASDVIRKVLALSKCDVNERNSIVSEQTDAMKKIGMFDVADVVSFLLNLE
jgi:hypothetical protein